jgi:cytochrome c-type biogenesis protein CcsB
MRLFVVALVAATIAASEVRGAEPAAQDMTWEAWRSLPVQHGGRRKPLDTLARESLRMISNRASFHDPDTGEQLGPSTLWVKMLLDWQGWENPGHSRLLLLTDWSPEYFHLHKADRWDREPLFRVDNLELRSVLGLEPHAAYVSAEELSAVQIDDVRTDRAIPFATWGRKLAEAEAAGEILSPLESKGLELVNRYWAYQNLRMGRSIEILPIRGSQAQEWMPIGALLTTDFSEATDPGGSLRQAQQLLWHVLAAHRAGDTDAFHTASDAFLTAVAAAGPELGDYANSAEMALEVAYNTWAPFRIAWILMLVAFVGMLLHLGSKWRVFYAAALATFVGALVALFTGFAMRIAIAGRPPVTNMYESVIYVGCGVAIFGLVLELLYRQKYILTAAAGVATVALILADNCPTVLDPALQPLQPVLRSNFWLVTHVMTITLSYAAFALAMGIATITLGYYFARSANQKAIAALSRFTYKAIQIGVLLLATGTILGGVWADYSWGRFWGWDPKEVWALVALLGYLAVLHARFAGWVGHRGLAALSVGCFALVIMAWYGVNFVLGAGLHSYGFGAGGSGPVVTALLLQLAFVMTALGRSRIAGNATIVGHSSTQDISEPVLRSPSGQRETRFAVGRR